MTRVATRAATAFTAYLRRPGLQLMCPAGLREIAQKTGAAAVSRATNHEKKVGRARLWGYLQGAEVQCVAGDEFVPGVGVTGATEVFERVGRRHTAETARDL